MCGNQQCGYTVMMEPSLSLQILFFIHYYYTLLFVAFTIILLIYKTSMFPYPSSVIVGVSVEGCEAIAVCLIMICDIFRVKLGSYGNRTRQRFLVILSVILSVMVAPGYIFLLKWQTYILALEKNINLIALGALGAESIIALITAAIPKRGGHYGYTPVGHSFSSNLQILLQMCPRCKCGICRWLNCRNRKKLSGNCPSCPSRPSFPSCPSCPKCPKCTDWNCPPAICCQNFNCFNNIRDCTRRCVEHASNIISSVSGCLRGSDCVRRRQSCSSKISECYSASSSKCTECTSNIVRSVSDCWSRCRR